MPRGGESRPKGNDSDPKALKHLLEILKKKKIPDANAVIEAERGYFLLSNRLSSVYGDYISLTEQIKYILQQSGRSYRLKVLPHPGTGEYIQCLLGMLKKDRYANTNYKLPNALQEYSRIEQDISKFEEATSGLQREFSGVLKSEETPMDKPIPAKSVLDSLLYKYLEEKLPYDVIGTLDAAKLELSDITNRLAVCEDSLRHSERTNEDLRRKLGQQSRNLTPKRSAPTDTIHYLLHKYLRTYTYASTDILQKAQGEYRNVIEEIAYLDAKIQEIETENETLQNPTQTPVAQDMSRTLPMQQQGKPQQDVSITRVTQERDCARAELELYKQRATDLEWELNKMHTMKEESDQAYEEMVHKNQEMKKQFKSEQFKLEEELNELKTRFSALAKDKLTRGNTAVADLSDVNRPTKLAEKFSELYDNEWTSAFEEIQKSYGKKKISDKDVIEKLLAILLESYNFSKYLTEKQLEVVENVIVNPHNIWDVPNTMKPQQPKPHRAKMFEELRASVVMLRKSMASEDDIVASVHQAFEQQCMARIRQMIPTANSPHTRQYIGRCLELTWLMCIQDPPMYLHCNIQCGEPFDLKKFKPYTKSGKKMDFLVWPALCLEQPKDGVMMSLASKGIAQPQ
ncbi:hypothetical protein ScPMuIL_010256 [Solemya velum]